MFDEIRVEGSNGNMFVKEPDTPDVDMVEVAKPNCDEMEMDVSDGPLIQDAMKDAGDIARDDEDPDLTLVDDGPVPGSLSSDKSSEGDSLDVWDGDEDGDYNDDGGGDGDDDDDDDASGRPHSQGQADIPKAAWTVEMIQTAEMSRLGICVSTAAKVVVCLECSAAIKPQELDRHLAKTHPPLSTTHVFCQGLIDEYNLHPDPQNLRPGSIVTAIYGLDLVGGFMACDDCGYACRAEKRMKTHVKKSEACRSYGKRYVQTFRPSSKQGYFGVKLHDAVDPIEDPLDPLVYLKENFTPIPFSHIPITCPAAQDTNHFLNIEQWHKHLEGKTGAEITHAVRERQPDLRTEVRICVERFGEESTKKLRKADHEPKAAMGDYIG